MKYLGIDYGERNIGLAVSNAEATIAFPRGTLANSRKLIDEIAHMCTEEGIERVVIGDTRAISGAPNPITVAAEDFAAKLQETLKMPVELAREGWTSIEASRFAPEGEGHNDAAAAAIILQRFLDMHARR